MPNSLKTTDPEVYEAIRKEGRRQREKVLLIASENFASPAVLAAQGPSMTNKYAEGYPGHEGALPGQEDRKSALLYSSHRDKSYAGFCLTKNNNSCDEI